MRVAFPVPVVNAADNHTVDIAAGRKSTEVNGTFGNNSMPTILQSWTHRVLRICGAVDSVQTKALMVTSNAGDFPPFVNPTENG